MSATGNKRHREDSEQTEQKSKKPKETNKVDSIGGRLGDATEQLKSWLVLLRPFATQSGLGLSNALERVEDLEVACETILRNPAGTPEALLPFFDEPLALHFVEKPEATSTITKAGRGTGYAGRLEMVRISLSAVKGLLNELFQSRKSPPSAFTYAKSAYWHYWQDQETAIFNLRPKKNQSLPLCILHPIFAQFIATYEGVLPDHPRIPLVHQIAHQLCLSMSEKFTEEHHRSEKFLRDIEPLFSEFETEVLIESDHRLEANASKVDMALEGFILGEIKMEFSTGDPYMQVSRSYQAQVHKYIAQNWENDGFPHLLICLLGPIIFVAGGFLDGERTIVEPLTDPCLMLPDYSKRRQNHLARILCATMEAFETLKLARSKINKQGSLKCSPAAIEGTPRVYLSFSDFEGKTHALTFLKRLDNGILPPTNLFFLAKSPINSDNPLLVKLVESECYGIDAHRALAQSSVAPFLFGFAKVKGSFMAIVMEYLDPSDGWMTLFEYKEQNGSIAGQPLHPQLAGLLSTMKQKHIVHGDLRPANIMVRNFNGGELEVKIIDFDWAGTRGEARYPVIRNPEIRWPGRSGELIGEDDDSILLKQTLRSPRAT
ncbi:hypothetical protein FRC17_001158 [Serendipita sp. 399]|nr:hypothetical protein FRC17_001158 [Serendipita sp. 399]